MVKEGWAPRRGFWGREGKCFRRKAFPSLPQWFYTILENEPAGDDADNDAVEQEGPEGLLDDHALAAGEAHNGADGHDVVDADHVAHAAADGLSGNDDFLGELQLRGHIPLELGEEQVGHGVGAGNEGAEAADVGSEGGPGFTGEGGEGLGEGERHGVHARVVHSGATEDGHQRHGGEQRDGRGLHLGAGGGPCVLHVVGLHAVEADGQDGDQREGNRAGQEQVVDGGVHALIAEDVDEAELEGGGVPGYGSARG